MLGSFMLILSNGFYIYVLTNFKFQITDIQFGGGYNVEYSQTNMPTGDEISAFEDKVQIRFKSDGNPSTVGLGFSIEWTSEELILTTAPGCKYQTFHLHLLMSCDTSLHPLSIQYDQYVDSIHVKVQLYNNASSKGYKYTLDEKAIVRTP